MRLPFDSNGTHCAFSRNTCQSIQNKLEDIRVVPSFFYGCTFGKTLKQSICDHTLIHKMLCQPFDNLNLLVRREPLYRSLNHATYTGLVDGYEALIVHKRKKPHDELTVHTIGDSAMTRNRFSKIFDFESAFQTRSKETSKRGDQGGESREYKDVKLDGHDKEGMTMSPERNSIWLCDENRVWYAIESSEYIGSEILDPS